MTENPPDPAAHEAHKLGADARAARACLEDCREFRELPKLVRELLFRCMKRRRFAAGSEVLKQGEAGGELMLVLEGKACATITAEDGSTRVLSRFTTGEIFGEMALVTKEPRSATVVAETELDVLALSAPDFDALATEFSSVAVVLTNLVAERLGRRWIDGLHGKVVDRYVVKRCIGRGGMAVVYQADEVEGGRSVALKMMSHQLVYTPGAMDRFWREAAILLHLDHANIARVYRQFPAFRTAFIAMEYCDGASLARLLREMGPVPEDVARAILGQLASALLYLHRNDVIHRDLKPGNVMFDRTGVLKLTDFGLAKPAGQPASGIIDPKKEIKPETSILAGTPIYMAPELFMGGEQRELSDFYSLGCVVYELLTGEPPVVSKDFGELVNGKLEFALPPRRRFTARVSRELHGILAHLLSTDPLERRIRLEDLREWGAPLPAKYFELDPETSF